MRVFPGIRPVSFIFSRSLPTGSEALSCRNQVGHQVNLQVPQFTRGARNQSARQSRSDCVVAAFRFRAVTEFLFSLLRVNYSLLRSRSVIRSVGSSGSR